MAGTFGRKAATLSLMLLQMLLWATLPELSKTLEAFWIAVPSLYRSKQGVGTENNYLPTQKKQAFLKHVFLESAACGSTAPMI